MKERAKVLKKEENLIKACFDFVSVQIVYEKDKRLTGYEEYWLFPRETLNRGYGDCEDTSFLLASLLLASGLQKSDVAVALGRYDAVGHAWVEVLAEQGWHILESTSNARLEVGRNAWSRSEGYERGYEPELRAFLTECEQVGNKGLFDRAILYY